MLDTIFPIVPGSAVECLIDGAHIHNVGRHLGFEINYAGLKRILQERFNLRRICYHTRVAYSAETSEIVNPGQQKVIDYLGFNGYLTKIKEVQEFTAADGRRTARYNVDAALAVEIIEAAVRRKVKEIIVIAGSEDLIPAVQFAQSFDARVIFGSTVQTQPEMISRDLRQQADDFFDLEKIRTHITRNEIAPLSATQSRVDATVVEDRRRNGMTMALGDRARVRQNVR
jgi:uncharacterized LabA/DUF88 family protein